MKKNFGIVFFVFSVLMLMFSLDSCRRKDPEPNTNASKWWSPAPGENGTIPTSVLPEALHDAVTAYFTLNEGENPPAVRGQFISSPHTLIHSTVANDTISIYNDRYVAFSGNNKRVNFYGKQWDDDENKFYAETYEQLYIIGDGDSFSCYYLSDGYPNGMYAKQATVFSGKWDESYGGLKDFQVAVLLLETSGNPNLAPANSFRVLGDGDGLAVDTAWMNSRNFVFDDVTISDEDAFGVFRIK